MKQEIILTDVMSNQTFKMENHAATKEMLEEVVSSSIMDLCKKNNHYGTFMLTVKYNDVAQEDIMVNVLSPAMVKQQEQNRKIRARENQIIANAMAMGM